MAGKWEFPGGKVEDGEMASDALVREIEEELQCGIEVGNPLPEVIHHYSECSIRLLPFCCRLHPGVIHLRDHSELRWVALSDCECLDWAQADIPVWQSLYSPGPGGGG